MGGYCAVGLESMMDFSPCIVCEVQWGYYAVGFESKIFTRAKMVNFHLSLEFMVSLVVLLMLGLSWLCDCKREGGDCGRLLLLDGCVNIWTDDTSLSFDSKDSLPSRNFF